MTNCSCKIGCLVITHVIEWVDSRDNAPETLVMGDGAKHQLAQMVRARAWKRMLELEVSQTIIEASLNHGEGFYNTKKELENTELKHALSLADGAFQEDD